MAETLTKDTALALLGNTLPTGAILVVLITILGPISGAHFNPAVSLVFALKRELPPRDAALYVAAQIIGGVAGTFAAHLMFSLPLIETSLKARTGASQWFAEWVATFGLSSRSLRESDLLARQSHGSSGPTSLPLTGSPPPPLSPIPPWRLRVR
jgi:glycerol uptake facilitator-like aquaporin